MVIGADRDELHMTGTLNMMLGEAKFAITLFWSSFIVAGPMNVG